MPTFNCILFCLQYPLPPLYNESTFVWEIWPSCSVHVLAILCLYRHVWKCTIDHRSVINCRVVKCRVIKCHQTDCVLTIIWRLQFCIQSLRSKLGKPLFYYRTAFPAPPPIENYECSHWLSGIFCVKRRQEVNNRQHNFKTFKQHGVWTEQLKNTFLLNFFLAFY